MQGWMDRWPLVGREPHLDSFRQDLAADRVHCWLIFGAPGVGKTRLAEEFLDLAAAGERRTARAVASRAAAQLPLGAIAHILPSGVDIADPVRGFRAVAQVLSGRPRPTVVLVYDLHLLDNSSAVLLGQLLDSRVVSLIGTARTGEQTSDAIHALLQRSDHVRRIDLGDMARHQLEELLQRVLEGPVGRRTHHALFTASGGNPLLLRELVLGALESGALALNDGVWDVSETRLPFTPTLMDLIAARISASPSAARPLLESLAFCGELSRTDAAAIADRTVLDDLERSGIVRVSAHRRRVTVALAHSLYGGVIAARTPALRRYDIALRQAERLEAHGLRRREDALRVASWRLDATGTADCVLLLRAAKFAMNSNDNERVIELLSAIQADQHTTESLVLLGRALMHAGQLERAESVLAEAEAGARDDHEKTIAAGTRCTNLFWSTPDSDRALTVCVTAQSALSDPVLANQFRFLEGGILTVGGTPARGLSMLDDLGEAPPQEGLDAWLIALNAKALGLVFVGSVEEARSLAEHARSVHETIGEGRLLPHPALQAAPLALSLMEKGMIDQARDVSVGACDVLQAAPAPVARQFLAFYSARAEWLAGRPLSARRWYGEAAAVARTHRLSRGMRSYLSGLMACAALVGDTDTAASLVPDVEANAPSGFLAGEEALGTAWLHVARGELGQARDLLRTAAADARGTGHLISEVLLLTDIGRLGDPQGVRERLNELSRRCDGALTHARARLVTALADDDPASLMDSSAELEHMGTPILAAEAAAAAAGAWKRRGDSRAATAATTRAARLAGRCEGARTPLLATIAGACAPLTGREQEIALLAAAGNTSKGISEHLTLSVRTVDNHLQRIYLKLGIRNRAELPRALNLDTGSKDLPR